MNILLDTLRTRRSFRWLGHVLGLKAAMGLLVISGESLGEAWRAGAWLAGGLLLAELGAALLDGRARKLKFFAPTVFPLKKMQAAERDFVQATMLALPGRSMARSAIVWLLAVVAAVMVGEQSTLAILAACGLGLPVAALAQGLGNAVMLKRILPFFYFEDNYTGGLAQGLPRLGRQLTGYLLAPLSVALLFPVLSSPWMTPLSWQVWAWLLAWALIAVWAATFVFHSLSVEPMRHLAQALRRLTGGELNVLLDVTSGDEVAEATEAYNKMTRAVDRRLFVLEKFGHSVAPGRAGELFDELKLDGETRNLAVIGVHWVSAAEDLAALNERERAAALNRFFEVVQDRVDAHQGSTRDLDFAWSSALWGAPLKDVDALKHAASCAWSLKARLEVWASQQRMRGLPTPRWGLGLAGGAMQAALLGPKGRERYVAFGEALNDVRALAGLGQGLRLQASLATGLEAPFKVQRVEGALSLEGGPDDVPPQSAGLGFAPGERLI